MSTEAFANFIGNDIVSLLSDENLRSFQSQRYLKKILTTTEINLYEYGKLDYLPAVFWSCKESIYKILLKNRFDSVFVAKNISIEVQGHNIINNKRCIVSKGMYNSKIFFCRSIINTEFVHSVAALKPEFLNIIETKEKEIEYSTPEQQSIDTHAFFIKYISNKLILREGDVNIKKNKQGIPLVFYKDKTLNISFSLSHDENFISFAFLNH